MKYIAFLFLFFALSFSLQSQEVLYTDYNPSYTKWKPYYILDKIEYTEERTIFHFRYIGPYSSGTATFFGIHGEFPWYLENTEDASKKVRLKEIKNIRQNEELKVSSLIEETEVVFTQVLHDVFTCEIHFPRLKNDVKKVHLIEGIGRKEYENHFNCFDVKLKTFDDPTLGTEDDLEKRIEEFITTNTGETPTKKEPTVLIKVVEEEKVADIEPPYPNS